MKSKKKFKYIYGPVASWRLGVSLGVDLVSQKNKACSFDCVYCQLGKTEIFTGKRKVFVPVKEIIKEINSLSCLKLDYITFSGAGEPALAKNLGQAIRAVKKIKKAKIAVITNASLLAYKGVRRDLAAADFVLVKLDAPSEAVLRRINRPLAEIKFAALLKGIKNFRAGFKGKLALQIMFVKENKGCFRELAVLVKRLHPDEVQLNTPLRPSASRPLSKKELKKIKDYFLSECGDKIKITGAYDVVRKNVTPLNKCDTSRRRGIELGVRS